MQKPSDTWKRIRRSALERAQRTAIDPLSPLYDIYIGVCVVYLAGFLHFSFFEYSSEITWLKACIIVGVAVAGALVPVLTGSVLTLHFAGRKIQRLIRE